MFNLFSISGLTRSLEVAYEARAATGKPGKTEDCGWRGSCESISFVGVLEIVHKNAILDSFLDALSDFYFVFY